MPGRIGAAIWRDFRWTIDTWLEPASYAAMSFLRTAHSLQVSMDLNEDAEAWPSGKRSSNHFIRVD